MQQTLFKSQLQPSDKRLTDLCGCVNALSAPRPLRFTDLEECTSQLPLSSQLVMKRSLSERHPQSGAVALPFAWVKVSHLVAVVSASLLERMWHLTPAFFFFLLLFSMPGRTERAAVHRLSSAYLISSRARSGTFGFHGRREIEGMWKCAFLLWNGLAQNSTISGFLSIPSCHRVL